MSKILISLVFFVLCSFVFIEGQSSLSQNYHGGGGGGGRWNRCPWGYRRQGRCMYEYDCGYRGFCYRTGFGPRFGTCCVGLWGNRWNDNRGGRGGRGGQW